MADDNQESGPTTRGNEWEVVSLTASAYAAVPGPGTVESVEEHRDKDIWRSDSEPPMPLFMSDHFVFPPCEHENLPFDLESPEVSESEPQEVHSTVDYTGFDNKQSFNADSLPGHDELPSIEYFDKGKQITVTGNELDEGISLDGQNLVETVESYYGTSNIMEAETYGESDDVTEPGCHSPKTVNMPSEISKSAKSAKAGNYGVSPFESWWRRHITSLYAQAKEANKFWSVFVAAALMGLVILGQRWKQETWQTQQLKWNLNNNDKIVHRVLGPVSRFKDVLIGTHKRGLGGISTLDG